MSDGGNDGPYRPPAEPPARREGIFGEARGLFDQRVGEAQRLDAEQRASTPPRGPIGKALAGAAIIAGVIAAGTLLYGAYNFLDAPLRQTPAGFVNKAGQPTSHERYEAFKLWEKGVVVTFVIAFAAAFATAAEEKIRKRRHGS